MSEKTEREVNSTVLITATGEGLEPVARVVMVDGIKILTEYAPPVPDAVGRAAKTTLETFDPPATVPDALELSKNLLERHPSAQYVFIHLGAFSMKSSQSLYGGLKSFRLDRGSDKFASLLVDADAEPRAPLKGETARIARNIMEELNSFKSQRRGTEITEVQKARSRFFSEKLGYLYDTLFAYQLKTQTAPRITNELPIMIQGKVSRQISIEYSTSNTANHPFKERYEPNRDKFVDLPPVKVTPRKSSVNAFNYVSIKGEYELDYFDWLVFSAYRTIRIERPDEPVVTYLDIANKLYVSTKKTSLRANQHKDLMRRIHESLLKLMTTSVIKNFLEEAKAYKNNLEYQRYLEDGGNGEIAFTYIKGDIMPVKTANGRVLDAVVGDSKLADSLLERYIQMSGQVRRIEGDILMNPLSATPRNIMIFHYLLDRVLGMPYGDTNNRLFERKGEHLESFKEIQVEIGKKRLEMRNREREIEARCQRKNSGRRGTFKREPIDCEADDTFRQLQGQLTELETIRTTLEEEARETAKAESKLPRRSMTISLDTMIKDLKLIKPGDSAERAKDIRNRVKDKVEKVLEHLREQGGITDFRVNGKTSGRGVQSFTVGIFSGFDNVNIPD